MTKSPCVYMLASRKHGTIYTGSTGDIAQRLSQHTEGDGAGFTKKYDVKRLVYVEFYDGMNEAMAREKQLKSWRRTWKVQLIEEVNPEWEDVAPDVLQ